MTYNLKYLFEQLPSTNITDLEALLKQHWHLHGTERSIVSAHLAIEDSAVAHGSRWRRPRAGNRLKALLSLQVQIEVLEIEQLVPPWPLLAAYVVDTAVVISPPRAKQAAAPQRTPGSLQVCLFRLRSDMVKEDALDYWRQEHAAIACATQSTFGYLQHVITSTETNVGAKYDGLVEEYFPDAALTSAEIFFNSKNPQQLSEHIAQLTASSSTFIDMTSLLVNHLSEYRIDLTTCH